MKAPTVLTVLSSFAAILSLSGCGSSLVTTSANTLGAAPTVTATAVQVNGVAPNRKQEVQFSEAMDASTINARSFTVTDSSGNAVGGVVTYDADYDIASFLPNPPLQTGATYSATVSTAVASVGGAHLAKPYTYTFSTRATTDTSPLSINSVSPVANATCVSTTLPITITFNEAPDASTVNSANIVVTGPNGAIPVTMGINVTTTQVVLSPNAALPSGTISVTVQNAADLAGVKMAAPYTWSFSTACNTSGPPPTGSTTQYQAPLFGKNANVGQVTVDTTGNFTVQLKGAVASAAFTVQFCPLIPLDQSNNCFSVGTVSTDANGDGSATAMFPKTGPWAGDFQLVTGAANPAGVNFDYETTYGPNYFATLQPEKTIDGGALETGNSSLPQAPLTSGSVTYSSSPAPNGSFQFTLKGAPANAGFSFTEGGLLLAGSENYELVNSQGNGYFTSDSQGDLTVTVLQDGTDGDILSVALMDSASAPPSQQGYFGGFSIP